MCGWVLGLGGMQEAGSVWYRKRCCLMQDWQGVAVARRARVVQGSRPTTMSGSQQCKQCVTCTQLLW